MLCSVNSTLRALTSLASMAHNHQCHHCLSTQPPIKLRDKSYMGFKCEKLPKFSISFSFIVWFVWSRRTTDANGVHSVSIVLIWANILDNVMISLWEAIGSIDALDITVMFSRCVDSRVSEIPNQSQSQSRLVYHFCYIWAFWFGRRDWHCFLCNHTNSKTNVRVV